MIRALSVALLVAASSLAAATVSSPARAQGAAEDAIRVSARQLGEEGTKLFQAGDYAGALDRFQRADALVPRQTLGLRVARCLAKLGRLNEAYERYVAVARMPVAPGLEPDIVALQNEAKQSAEAEGAALLPRIPSLVIDVKGATAPLRVTVDGVDVPPALLGVKRAVDPGSHQLVATSAGQTATRRVAVKEGEVLPVTLSLDAAPVPAPPPVAPSLPPTPPPAVARTPPPDAPRRLSTQYAAGIALLAVGGAGLVVGAAVGGAAVAKKSSLVPSCGASLQCPPPKWGDADAYNTLRTASTVGFAVGAGVAAVGAVVLLTAPKAATPSPRAALWVGPQAAGVRGTW